MITSVVSKTAAPKAYPFVMNRLQKNAVSRVSGVSSNVAHLMSPRTVCSTATSMGRQRLTQSAHLLQLVQVLQPPPTSHLKNMVVSCFPCIGYPEAVVGCSKPFVASLLFEHTSKSMVFKE